MTRQMPYEPLPASVLLGPFVGNSSPEKMRVKNEFISISPKSTEAGDDEKHNTSQKNGW